MTSPTVTVIVSLSDRFGDPSSVTITSKVKVPGPSASSGVQLNTPVPGSMAAPVGTTPPRLKTRLLAGLSGLGGASVVQKEKYISPMTASHAKPQ